MTRNRQTLFLGFAAFLLWNIPAQSQSARSFGGAHIIAAPVAATVTAIMSSPAGQFSGARYDPRVFAPHARNSAEYRGGQRYPRPLNPLAAQQPFPTALANNVALGAFSGATLYGNINQPGLPPGTPPAIPNINIPSGSVGGRPINVLPAPPGRRGHRGSDSGNTVIYLPSYVPAPYFYSQPDETEEAPPQAYDPSAQAPPVVPAPQVYYVAPLPAQTQPESASALPVAQEPAMPIAPQKSSASEHRRIPKPVTELAFKDHSVVAVTDYWLEGSFLIYSVSGLETDIPLEDLDFPRTVQLNQARNVQLSLESKP